MSLYTVPMPSHFYFRSRNMFKLIFQAFWTVCFLLGTAGLERAPLAMPLQTPSKSVPAPNSWHAQGKLLESCTCNVPCPCNFGQPPSHSFCNALFIYQLEQAQYSGVVLDGLCFGGCDGPKAAIGFLDERATPTQREALLHLAEAVFAKGGPDQGKRQWLFLPIKTQIGPTHFQIQIGRWGGFQAQVLLGADRKNPIVVENNVTWPVFRFIKGKADILYSDSYSNHMNYRNVNANIGDFHLLGAIAPSTNHPKKKNPGE